ncbi:MAG: RNA-binding protein [Paludibacter sp.]|nr:RNA-binding protein [Paludibacter sp.]
MNIFVAKLSFGTTDEDLKQLFGEYGEVSSAHVVTDKMTGRSKGYGFIEMPDDEAANKAIKELNECEYDGRVIAVSQARPREEKSYSDNRGGYGNNGNRSRRY